MDRRIPALLLAFTVLTAVSYIGIVESGITDDSSDRPENIVYISVDGLAAEHTQCYGYSRETAPNICGLENSIVYENAYTTSIWERLAIPSMMTGKYPHRANVINSHTPLNPEYDTIAEVLNRNGYHTVMRMGNPFFPNETNADQGFNDYQSIEFNREGDLPDKFGEKLKDGELYYRLHIVGPHNPHTPTLEHYNYSDYKYIDSYNDSTANMVEKYRSRYRKVKNRSVFQNLSEEDRTRVVNHYDENIRAVDQYIGYYIDQLKEEGEYNDSMIIITSDYGMSFNDHGEEIWNHMNSNPPTSKVPLVVKYPDSQKSSTSEKLVSVMDPFKMIMNEVDGSTDYELDAIDPRTESREQHFTYTMRGTSMTNGTHFAFNNMIRNTWSYYRINESGTYLVEKEYPSMKGQVVNFREEFLNADYERTDFGYEDIRED